MVTLDAITRWRQETQAKFIRAGMYAELDDRLYGAKSKDGFRFPKK